MLSLEPSLKLNRCPHCSIDNPNLIAATAEFKTGTDTGGNQRNWIAYRCVRCGGVVTASCSNQSREISQYFPKTQTVNEILPPKVKAYLQQAIDSVSSPAGAVMLCASAVDAILKEKNLLDGTLYARINKAATDGLLTKEMATWAHQVRLDANDQRHSDVEAELPTVEEAKQSIEFVLTLAEFLFVLPSKVTRGIEATRQLA